MTESCRLITTEQYQEYLKLKEEHKPLSWEELKEEAKKMGYVETEYPDSILQESVCKDNIWFYKGGWISAENDLAEIDIACGRSYDQMLAIMKALQ